MNTLDYLHLNNAEVPAVISGLKQLLADYQIFYANLRGYHWNIRGRGFFILHSKFEEMYDDAAGKVDEIAERILMLGEEPENDYNCYLKTARVETVSHVSCAEKAMRNVLDTLSYLIGEERKLMELASKAGDETTVAMLGDYLRGQEKHVWMLAAFVSGDCGTTTA